MFFRVSRLSSRLAYKFAETEFQPEVVEAVRKAYGLDIGKGFASACFCGFCWVDWYCGVSPFRHFLSTFLFDFAY